jgi:hypothetical protein
MNQPRLFPAPAAGKKTPRSKADAFDVANLRSAKEILAHPEQHGGELAYPVQWARDVVKRLDREGVKTP